MFPKRASFGALSPQKPGTICASKTWMPVFVGKTFDQEFNKETMPLWTNATRKSKSAPRTVYFMVIAILFSVRRSMSSSTSYSKGDWPTHTHGLPL